jgi:hypothetical protein
MDSALNDIEGAAELERWFGYWPNFHDAEVGSILLNRVGISIITIHTWDRTKKVDSDGRFILERHVVVHFELEKISDLKLEGFNQQNVVFEISITKAKDTYRLELSDCYGIGGYLEAGTIRIRLAPGIPADYPNCW